jgi:hypothetical protein
VQIDRVASAVVFIGLYIFELAKVLGDATLTQSSVFKLSGNCNGCKGLI